MRDAAGRFAAEPLRKGGRFCRFHTILFPREPARACESIVVYIDLETNSLDVLSGKIVEIGALVDGSRATFSTVVHPGRDAPLDDASVQEVINPFQRLDNSLDHLETRGWLRCAEVMPG